MKITKSLNIVARKKNWFSILGGVALLTAIMLIIFAFAANSPVNLGTEFAGGYTISLKSSGLNEDTFRDYKNTVSQIAEELTDEQGDCYGLRIADFRRVGTEGLDTSIQITYKRIKGLSEEEMTTLGERFTEQIKSALVQISPEVVISGGQATLTYNRIMSAFSSNIEQQIKKEFPAAQLTWKADSFTELTFANAGALSAQEAEIKDAASILDGYSGSVSEARKVSARVGIGLVLYMLSAAIVLFFVAFVYLIIRYKSISTAASIVLSVLIDVAMMVCFMFIIHAIEITTLFLFGILAVIAYSFHNKIMTVDKLRENIRLHAQELNVPQLVDKTVGELLLRTIIICKAVAGLFAILAIVMAIAGIMGGLVFAVPVVFGLIASAFTTLFIMPSIWSIFNKTVVKTKEKSKTKKKEKQTI